MASRQLKKLRLQHGGLTPSPAPETAAADNQVSSEDDFVSPPPRKNAFAGFAALADDDASDGHNGSGDDGDKAREAGCASSTAPVRTKKAKKTKKGRGNAKAKGGEKDTAPDSNPSSAIRNRGSAKQGPQLDEIDRALAELNLPPNPHRPTRAAQSPESAAESLGLPSRLETAPNPRALLRLSFRRLRAANEMRQLFGTDTIRAAHAEAADARPPTHGHAGQIDLETYLGRHPGMRPLADTVMRANPFGEGKKTWPADAPLGLSMECLEGGGTRRYGPCSEFTFVHAGGYDSLEAEFFHLVQTYDPTQLVNFLAKHPYHISTLIQVSKFAIQQQNTVLAADLCERALFTFGRVTLSQFRKKLELGQAAMDFARPENRQFYLAGYQLIKNLIKKGTYRTALEWAKLYLSLDLDDPYAMMQWIPILAIRAHEAQWLVELSETPLSREGTALYPWQSLPLAKLQLHDRPGAMALLVEGMEQLPWLYTALFQALDLDAPRSIWGVQPRDPEEQLHTELYVHMAKELWQTPDATSLLVAAGNAADKVHNLELLPAALPVSLGTARLVYLDGTPSLMAAVPRGMLHTSPNFDFDPLPPPRSENKFSNHAQELAWEPLTENEAMQQLFGQAGLQSHEPPSEEALNHLAELVAQPSPIRQLLEFFVRGNSGPGSEGEAGVGDMDSEVAVAADDYDDDDDGEMLVPGAWVDGDEEEGEEGDGEGRRGVQVGRPG